MRCKYITVDSLITYRLIEVLYRALNEPCGGLAHIVVDDNNLDDNSLKFVINECKKEENKDRADVNVCILICEALLRLTLEQRYFIFSIINNGTTSMYEGIDILCVRCCMYTDEYCSECPYKEVFDNFMKEHNYSLEADIK